MKPQRLSYLNPKVAYHSSIYYILIGGMINLDHHDEVPMVSALMYMIIHWIGPMVGHDIRLSDGHDFTKLLYYIVS